MSMDHRWGMREPIEREVLIACDTAMPLRGRSLNVSFSGIFVSVSQAPLKINALVELVARLRSAGVTSVHRMVAAVARLSEHGVGLMFYTLDPGEITRFLALLRGADSFLVLRQPDPRRLFVRSTARDGMFVSVVGGPKIETTAVTADPDPCQDGYPVTGGNHDHGQRG